MNIGILISGRGSNMLTIIEAVLSGKILDSRIVVVISDNPNAAGLISAAEKNIEVLVIERTNRPRAAHDAEIIAELKKRNVELVCLAGYMRLLSSDFIEAFPDRIINIHPSLLPAFPGLEAQHQALHYGVKITGCTVHFVDKGLDSGAIIAQRSVPIFDNDTVEILSQRILAQEHELYVESLRLIVQGNYRIVNRRVLFDNRTIVEKEDNRDS